MNNQVIANIIHESVTESESTIINESNGKIYATGIIQDLDIENRNGRIYQPKDMLPEVNGDRIQKELIPSGYMRGHAGHPASTELSIQSVIDPKICCVQYDKIWNDGNLIRANYHGTNNEYGRAFNADLAEGCKPAFSLRALGSVDRGRDGKCYVRNIRIITWDHVIYPSHKRAYTEKIIDAKTAIGGGTMHEAALITESAAYNGDIIPITNKSVTKFVQSESANIKSILNTFDTLYESAMICNGGKNVMMQLKGGDKIVVNLEQYIQNEIMDYCYNM